MTTLSSKAAKLQTKALTLQGIADEIKDVAKKLSEDNIANIGKVGGRMDAYSRLVQDSSWSKELAFMGLILGVSGAIIGGAIEQRPEGSSGTIVSSTKNLLNRVAKAVEKGKFEELHASLRDLYAESLRLVTQ